MLVDVGQRLLDDPERGEIEARRQGPRFALDVERHGRSRRAGALDQRRQLREPGLGSELGARSVLAQDAEQAPHLAERVLGGLSDRGQRFPGERGVAIERGLGAVGLDRDHAQPVGDDVVQLASDPRPLLGDRELGGALALVLEFRGELFEPARLLALAAHHAAHQRREDDRGDRPHVLAGHLVIEPGAEDRQPDAERRDRHDDPQVGDVRSQRVEEDERGDEADDDVAVGGYAPRQRPDHGRGRRVGQPPGDRQRRDQRDRDADRSRRERPHEDLQHRGNGEREGEQEIGATEADRAEIIRAGGARHQPVG